LAGNLNDGKLKLLGLEELIAVNEAGVVAEQLAGNLNDGKLNEIIRVYLPNGEMIYTNRKTQDLAVRKIIVPKESSNKIYKNYYLIQGEKHQYLALMQRYNTFDEGTLFVEIATTRLSPSNILHETFLPLSLTLLILFGLAFWMAKTLTKTSLQPLHELANATDQIDIHNIKKWNVLATFNQPKEFVPLITKINELMTRIQSTLLNSQYLGRYIAHEVRTPLTIMQGEIETTLQRPSSTKADLQNVLHSSLEEISKIETVVASILKLSKMDIKAEPYKPTSLQIKPFVRTLVDELSRQTQLPIQLSVNENLGQQTVFIDQELLRLLIGNLLRNIAKHVDTGAHVVIRLYQTNLTDVRPEEIVIEMDDNGQGMSAELLANANSQDANLEGLGIGLTLCKRIAQVSNLKLHFMNLQPHGLRVQIFCPK
jgi:two-component system sensor histidine kinase TctE